MPLDRLKLSRVLALTSSPFDGEALAAARRANEMVRSAGLPWETILAGNEIATAACRRLMAENEELLEELARVKAELSWTPGAWVEPMTTTEKIDRAVEYTEFITDWERGFACDLAGWRGLLTPKQQRRLDELIDKLRRIARARGLAA